MIFKICVIVRSLLWFLKLCDCTMSMMFTSVVWLIWLTLNLPPGIFIKKKTTRLPIKGHNQMWYCQKNFASSMCLIGVGWVTQKKIFSHLLTSWIQSSTWWFVQKLWTLHTKVVVAQSEGKTYKGWTWRPRSFSKAAESTIYPQARRNIQGCYIVERLACCKRFNILYFTHFNILMFAVRHCLRLDIKI